MPTESSTSPSKDCDSDSECACDCADRGGIDSDDPNDEKENDSRDDDCELLGPPNDGSGDGSANMLLALTGGWDSRFSVSRLPTPMRPDGALAGSLLYSASRSSAGTLS